MPPFDDYVPDCPAPLETIKLPRLRLPANATDCHFHVFGPYAQYPLAQERSYSPPAAPLDRYRALAAALRLERCVIVQPSIYGSDNRCTLAALEALRGTDGQSARAVIGLPTDDAVAAACMTPARLQAWHAAGVRGVRYNSVTGAALAPEKLLALARRIAPLGWHLQMYVSAAELMRLVPIMPALPVDVVVDHFGGIDPALGLHGEAFSLLRALLDTGRAWLKIVGYRVSHERAPFADLTPFVRALMQSHPERLVWGTNWPHPVHYDEMPDDGALVDALGCWLENKQALHQVLVDNPARLYGFPGSAPAQA